MKSCLCLEAPESLHPPVPQGLSQPIWHFLFIKDWFHFTIDQCADYCPDFHLLAPSFIIISSYGAKRWFVCRPSLYLADWSYYYFPKDCYWTKTWARPCFLFNTVLYSVVFNRLSPWQGAWECLGLPMRATSCHWSKRTDHDQQTYRVNVGTQACLFCTMLQGAISHHHYQLFAGAWIPCEVSLWYSTRQDALKLWELGYYHL